MSTAHFLHDKAEHGASMDASKAWSWLKTAQKRTPPEWLKVGAGCLIGRAWAMRNAGTNLPKGRGYNEQFAAWLKAYKLDDIDQADRSHLFKLMDHPEIQEWRNKLPDDKRNKLNYPTAILRAYGRPRRVRRTAALSGALSPSPCAPNQAALPNLDPLSESASCCGGL